MVKVIEKQTDFNGLLMEFFGSAPVNDTDYKYSNWTQEYKIIIKNSDANITELISDTYIMNLISKTDSSQKTKKSDTYIMSLIPETDPSQKTNNSNTKTIVKTETINTKDIKNHTNKNLEKANREK